jgi:hypothetical protein
MDEIAPFGGVRWRTMDEIAPFGGVLVIHK